MDKRCKRNVVSMMSSVMAVMRLPISCVLNGHVVPCASCLHGKWIENMSDGQFCILVNLGLCGLIGCCTLLAFTAVLSIACLSVILTDRPTVRNYVYTYTEATSFDGLFLLAAFHCIVMFAIIVVLLWKNKIPICLSVRIQHNSKSYG